MLNQQQAVPAADHKTSLGGQVRKLYTNQIQSAKPEAFLHSFEMEPANAFYAHNVWNWWGGTGLGHKLNRNRLQRAGKAIVHPHVVIDMPSQLVQNDQLQANGVLARELAAALSKLHQKDYANDMAEGVQARYLVRKDAALDAKKIRVSFGQGVYVPAEGEAKAWKVEWSMDGAVWNTVTEIYDNQSLAVVGGKRAIDPFPGWPFGADVSVVVQYIKDAQEVRVVSEPADVLSVEPGAAGIYKIRSADGELYCCLQVTALFDVNASKAAKSAANAPAPVTAQPVPAPKQATVGGGRKEPVLAEPLVPVMAGAGMAPAAATAPAAPKAAAGASASAAPASAAKPVAHGVDDDKTHIALTGSVSDSLTMVQGAGGAVETCLQGMSLVGIALQRVSKYAPEKIFGLKFAVDGLGNVVRPGSTGARATFAVSSGDALTVETAQGVAEIALAQPIMLSSSLEVALQEFAVSPSYIGLYRLPTPQFEALQRGKGFTFGRNAATVLPGLRKLHGPGFLHKAEDTDGDKAGLSRVHVALEVTDEGLHVTPKVEPWRVLHLDKDLKLIERASDGSQDSFMVLPGQHLVTGHYVLRYDA